MNSFKSLSSKIWEWVPAALVVWMITILLAIAYGLRGNQLSVFSIWSLLWFAAGIFLCGCLSAVADVLTNDDSDDCGFYKPPLPDEKNPLWLECIIIAFIHVVTAVIIVMLAFLSIFLLLRKPADGKQPTPQ